MDLIWAARSCEANNGLSATIDVLQRSEVSRTGMGGYSGIEPSPRHRTRRGPTLDGPEKPGNRQ
ncbi:MAG: hypothetical protein K0R13_253 [Propionibacteriaceae bacterium]|jgi:hypothetical protein|nr:hypothetical protein [Propionibacteriaceae bacterium]